MARHPTESAAPPEQFVSDVKDALEHLYDPAHLGSHPLADLLLPQTAASGASRVFRLRQLLLDFIARLDPGAAVPAASLARRAYRLLDLRFVHALPFREVVGDLGLSQAQYHRDQRHALQALAQLLWEHTLEHGSRPARPASPVAGLVDLDEVIAGVVETLAPATEQREITVVHESAGQPSLVAGDRTVVRQLVISLASSLMDASPGAELTLSGGLTDGVPVLRVARRGDGRPLTGQAAADQGLADARELLEAVGGALTMRQDAAGLVIEAHLPLPRRSVLVVDDNADIVQMIRRFLADHRVDVHSAPSVDEGLTAARRLQPDLILLDIMIPERDGWDGLQALKHDPDTQQIPVLVCTVLRESQLAQTLGADGFLRKPLTLPALLDALERWAPDGLRRR